jgi:hypothetical protein
MRPKHVAGNKYSNVRYCRVWLPKTPFVLVTGFITHLQVVTTITYSTLAGLHNSQSLRVNVPLLSFLPFSKHTQTLSNTQQYSLRTDEVFQTSSTDWLISQSQSHIATDGQSVCLSWCRAPAVLSYPCGAPSLTRGRVCHFSVIVYIISPLSLCKLIYNWVLISSMYNIYKAFVSPGSIQILTDAPQYWLILNTQFCFNQSQSHIATDGRSVSQ